MTFNLNSLLDDFEPIAELSTEWLLIIIPLTTKFLEAPIHSF